LYSRNGTNTHKKEREAELAKEIITPACEVTDLPLPLFPAEPRENGALLISSAERLLQRPTDLHHHWHPARELKSMGSQGEALRNCRVQQVSWGLHHLGYHNVFKGPDVPNNKEDIFRKVVLSVAGVVPRQAIDIKRGDFKIIDLSQKQHNQLANRISIANSKPISRFFADFVASQDMKEVVSSSEIEEFLDRRTTRVRKHEIARILLSGAIDLSVDYLGLNDEHQLLKRQGFFTKPKPATPRWIAKKFIRLRYMDYFLQKAEDQLATT